MTYKDVQVYGLEYTGQVHGYGLIYTGQNTISSAGTAEGHYLH